MDGVTSLSDLQRYALGELVELPGFVANEPFRVRLRRPSLMVLAKSGKIPNSLLSAANQLFTGKENSSDPVDFSETTRVMELICEASMVDPTYSQLQEVGLDLTDQQMVAIFGYSQRGLEALSSFREKPSEHKVPDRDVQDIPKVSG